MRVITLVNTTSGAVRRLGADELKQTFTSALRDHGIAAKLMLADGPSIKKAAEQGILHVRRRNFDAVVVAGGDGFGRHCCWRRCKHLGAVGYTATRTLNHFAKDLGIPTDLDGAVALIAAGHVRQVDAAEVNGRVFVNNSSIGPYPHMVLSRERWRARRLRSKWTATALAFLRTFRDFPGSRLEIRAEGRDDVCGTPCVFVGNNEYRTNLFEHVGRASLDSGELSIVVLRPRARSSLLWLGIRLAFGLELHQEDVTRYRSRAAEILSPASSLLVALDGEVATVRTPLIYRSRPEALRVFASPVD